MNSSTEQSGYARRLIPMLGRDPHEQGRVASPLELLYDLTFVVAIGVASEQLAEMVAAGHPGRGFVGFGFAMFAILLAWINFSWFASAFDTDDWLYRLLTMVQMVGVVVFSLGIAPMFHSIEEGHHVDVVMMVGGYVVMRVALVAQWARVSRQSPQFRSVALRNIWWISVCQLGWVALAALDLDLGETFTWIVLLGLVEFAVPVFAQGRASGTPWHPHHIAERYGLFAIIALGEGVVGTVASSRGALGGATGDDWSAAAVLVLVAGVGMTFSMWWIYFLLPFGDLLHSRPGRGYVFGYGHLPVFAAIAATGAGLHVAGLYLESAAVGEHSEHHLAITPLGVVVMVAAALAVYYLALVALLRGLDSPVGSVWIILGTLAVLGLAVLVGARSMPAGLIIAMLGSFVPVLGHEIADRRHSGLPA